jgi:hypothetical protein
VEAGHLVGAPLGYGYRYLRIGTLVRLPPKVSECSPLGIRMRRRIQYIHQPQLESPRLTGLNRCRPCVPELLGPYAIAAVIESRGVSEDVKAAASASMGLAVYAVYAVRVILSAGTRSGNEAFPGVWDGGSFKYFYSIDAWPPRPAPPLAARSPLYRLLLPLGKLPANQEAESPCTEQESGLGGIGMAHGQSGGSGTTSLQASAFSFPLFPRRLRYWDVLQYCGTCRSVDTLLAKLCCYF